MRHRPRHRPPWWPANEPWPPADRAQMWRHGRARFVRRMAVAFAAVLFLSGLGAATLLSMLLRGYPIGAATLRLGPIAVIVAGFLVLMAVFAGVRRIGVPLSGIVEAANRVADGDYSVRIAEHGPPSIRTVGTAFNSMAARLEAQDRQRRHLLADIAHELRTPLSVIEGRLEGLLDGVYARDDQELGKVLEETRLLARLVDDLRTLSHAESGMLALQKEPADLAILLHDAAGSLSAEAAERRVSIRLDVPPALPLVSIDQLRIREVVINLLSNALRHTPEGGVVTVSAEGGTGIVTVAVSDTGSGIAAEDLPKIFDRFYKGATSRGSGLGLTIARNLVAAHGGEISAASRQGHGATITFSIPIG
jgi:signal transduction histidine kinase